MAVPASIEKRETRERDEVAVFDLDRGFKDTAGEFKSERSPTLRCHLGTAVQNELRDRGSEFASSIFKSVFIRNLSFLRISRFVFWKLAR